jgi:hypothetical protein
MTNHISIEALSEIEEAAQLGHLVDEYQAIDVSRDSAWSNEVLWLIKEIKRLRQSRRRAVWAWRERREREQEAINEWADSELEEYDRTERVRQSRRRILKVYRSYKRRFIKLCDTCPWDPYLTFREDYYRG